MKDRQEFVGNFLTEKYVVFLDGTVVNHISAGCWADLESVVTAAENKLDEKIMAGKRMLTRYINTEKNHIMFYTYKEDDWWTL